MVRMKIINWWEIGDNQYVTLTSNSINNLKYVIKCKFGSLSKMSKLLSISPITLWYKFNKRDVSMSMNLLKNILKSLDLDFNILNSGIKSIGIRKGIRNPKFPLRVTPYFSELIGHAFFDGYADMSIFRYSNYDPSIRKEFTLLVRRLNFGNIKINNPDNIEQDINLPDVIPKLLVAVFDINTFYSDSCRIPNEIYDLSHKNQLYAWFFIKAAYLDEGTITGGQIFLLSGVKNYELVKDLQNLCSVVKIKTEIKERNPGYYSLLVKEKYYPLLYEIFTNTLWNRCSKIGKLLRKIKKWKKIQEKEENYKKDLVKILEEAKKKMLTYKDVMRLCSLSENPARVRLHLLVRTGNLKRMWKNNRDSEYSLISEKLDTIPRINDIKRLLGWRK